VQSNGDEGGHEWSNMRSGGLFYVVKEIYGSGNQMKKADTKIRFGT